MLEFLRMGGAPSLIIVVLGAAALILGALFARRPDPRQLEILKAITVTLVFSVLAGTCAAVRAVLTRVPIDPEWSTSPELPRVVMEGLGEALAPAVLGFGLLTAYWLLIALGLRRLARQM